MSILDKIFGISPNLKKKNLVRMIYVTVAAILLVTLTLAFALAFSSDKTRDDDKNDDIPSETVIYPFSDTKTGTLLVVNKKSTAYDFSANPESALVLMHTALPSADGSSLYVLQKEGMLANEEALQALNEMIGDFYKQAPDKQAAKRLSIRTAYRSYETQKALNSSVPAGHSDFHTGMLFELTVGSSVTSIKTDSTFNWIYENAHKYGFIERYPESKSSVTGVSDFDNAFRYVGTPHSTYIKENGLSLEEYVDRIQKSSELPVGGYKISYVKATENTQTEIVHKARFYSVSGDNNGGFIVTSK